MINSDHTNNSISNTKQLDSKSRIKSPILDTCTVVNDNNCASHNNGSHGNTIISSSTTEEEGSAVITIRGGRGAAASNVKGWHQSSNAYMLIYEHAGQFQQRKKSNFAAAAHNVDVPAHLAELVAHGNAVLLQKAVDVKVAEMEEDKRIAARQCEIVQVLRSTGLACTSNGMMTSSLDGCNQQCNTSSAFDDMEFIPRDWLVKWIKDPASAQLPSLIEWPSKLLCQHGRLKPDASHGAVKIVKREAIDTLLAVSKGYFQLSKRFIGLSSLCLACVKMKCMSLKFDAKAAELAKRIDKCRKHPITLVALAIPPSSSAVSSPSLNGSSSALAIDVEMCSQNKQLSDNINNTAVCSYTNSEIYYWVSKSSLNRWKYFARKAFVEQFGIENGMTNGTNSSCDELAQETVTTGTIAVDEDLITDNCITTEQVHQPEIIMTTQSDQQQDTVTFNNAVTTNTVQDDVSSLATFNADILCCHGNLCIDEKRRILIPASIWSSLISLFPVSAASLIPIYTHDMSPCFQCLEVHNLYTDLALQHSISLGELFSSLPSSRLLQLGSNLPDNVPFVWLISTDFITTWKRFMKNPCSLTKPNTGLSVYDFLYCQHSKLYQPIFKSTMWLYEAEWRIFSRDFDIKQGVQLFTSMVQSNSCNNITNSVLKSGIVKNKAALLQQECLGSHGDVKYTLRSCFNDDNDVLLSSEVCDVCGLSAASVTSLSDGMTSLGGCIGAYGHGHLDVVDREYVGGKLVIRLLERAPSQQAGVVTGGLATSASITRGADCMLSPDDTQPPPSKRERLDESVTPTIPEPTSLSTINSQKSSKLSTTQVTTDISSNSVIVNGNLASSQAPIRRSKRQVRGRSTHTEKIIRNVDSSWSIRQLKIGLMSLFQVATFDQHILMMCPPATCNCHKQPIITTHADNISTCGGNPADVTLLDNEQSASMTANGSSLPPCYDCTVELSDSTASLYDLGIKSGDILLLWKDELPASGVEFGDDNSSDAYSISGAGNIEVGFKGTKLMGI